MPETTTPTDGSKPSAPLTPAPASPLHPEDTAEAAGKLMRENDATRWPVTTPDDQLIGVVENKNADLELGGHGHDPQSYQVSQIMSRDFVFCYEDEDCAAAQKLMEERGLLYLPVVDRQMKIVGIFSKQEISDKAGAADNAGQTISQSIGNPSSNS